MFTMHEAHTALHLLDFLLRSTYHVNLCTNYDSFLVLNYHSPNSLYV